MEEHSRAWKEADRDTKDQMRDLNVRLQALEKHEVDRRSMDAVVGAERRLKSWQKSRVKEL